MKKILTTLAIIVCLASNLSAQESPKSKVVFFRTFHVLFESFWGFNVFKDTTKITRLRPYTFEVLEVEAKPTRFWAKTEVKRHVDIDVRPNHIYFVRARFIPGIFWPRPRFETLTIDEFKKLVAKKTFLKEQIRKAGYENVDDFVKAYEGLNVSSL